MATTSRMLPLLASLFLTACEPSEDDVYTLYRRVSVEGAEHMRVHVATFDARRENDGYNMGNCEHVRRLLQAQPSAPARFWWCEKGRYRE